MSSVDAASLAFVSVNLSSTLFWRSQTLPHPVSSLCPILSMCVYLSRARPSICLMRSLCTGLMRIRLEVIMFGVCVCDAGWGEAGPGVSGGIRRKCGHVAAGAGHAQTPQRIVSGCTQPPAPCPWRL